MILDQITRRRFRSFFKQKRARVGLTGFLFLFVFSMTAEIWSNSKPLFLNREGHWFFPVFVHYAPADFQITDAFVVDYRDLLKKDLEAGKATRALFPLNAWDPYEQSAEVMQGPSPTHWLGTDS